MCRYAYMQNSNSGFIKLHLGLFYLHICTFAYLHIVSFAHYFPTTTFANRMIFPFR